jgi:predicted phage terminase large subunit-like protein
MSQLEEIKATMSEYFWSAMYQQSPKPIGGNVFSDSCVQYYRVVPERFDKVIQSWDMTFKDTDGSDYVVGQVWGKIGANAYLLAQTRDRMTFTRSKAAVKALSAAWPQAQRKLVEDKANGPAILDSLRTEIHGMIAVEPDGSKLARAYAVADIWEGRNVYLPDPALAPWIKQYVDELTMFPASSHDDQVDATTQALRDLYPRRRAFFISDEALSQL